MIKKYALLDEKSKVVIGTIDIPNHLDISNPAHSPYVLLKDKENIQIGMAYDKETKEFSIPESPIEPVTKIITHPDQISDPPLPDGKKGIFQMFRGRR